MYAIYNGDIYIADLDECESDPCRNNGICHDKFGKYVCTCNNGFTGKLCEIGMSNSDSYSVKSILFFLLFINCQLFLLLFNCLLF